MFYLGDTDGRFIRPQTKEYRTRAGEDAYYRHHSLTWPRPFAHLRARLAALRLPRTAQRTAHPTALVRQ